MSSSSGGMTPPRAPLPITFGGVLPETYNETRLVLLPRDPHWIFAYWDLSEATVGNTQRVWGTDIFDRSPAVLRVHDVTGISFHGDNSHYYWDVRVPLQARRWYVEAKDSGRSYCIELGLIGPDGKFILLARSNVITLPTGRIAGPEEGQDKWMSVNENFEKVLELSGGTVLGSGSMEVSKILAHRFELLQGISSWASSPTSSWQQPPAPGQAPKEEAKDFWLLADTMLLIRGKAPPDATVTLKGQPLTLQADGSFVVQFSLHDMTLDLPIKATSADGTQKREVTFVVERKTTQKPSPPTSV